MMETEAFFHVDDSQHRGRKQNCHPKCSTWHPFELPKEVRDQYWDVLLVVSKWIISPLYGL